MEMHYTIRLSFLDRVYQDDRVWMTHNASRQSDGAITIQLPPPRHVRLSRTYRQAYWSSSHPHTFRRELFDHVPQSVMYDPKTGGLWASADDMALYLPMLELAGDHARHVWRITCIYNFHAQTEHALDRSSQLDRASRICSLPPMKPLERLDTER